MTHTHSENCGHVLTGTVYLYDNNHPYSAAVIAKNAKDEPPRLSWSVASLMARSDEDAIELALELARIKWPAGEGWYGHEAKVIMMARPCPESV